MCAYKLDFTRPSFYLKAWNLLPHPLYPVSLKWYFPHVSELISAKFSLHKIALNILSSHQHDIADGCLFQDRTYWMNVVHMLTLYFPDLHYYEYCVWLNSDKDTVPLASLSGLNINSVTFLSFFAMFSLIYSCVQRHSSRLFLLSLPLIVSDVTVLANCDVQE